MKKHAGFIIQVTLRNRVVSKDAPGMILQFRSVLVEESIVKAFKEAVAQCPGDKEIVEISLSETPVFLHESILAVNP